MAVYRREEFVPPSRRLRVLVTGGAGFVGAHCCKAFFDAGYEPVCYDNLSTGHREFVRWGPLIVGDIRDAARLRDTVRGLGIVAVAHFAASSLVGESISDPHKYYHNNLVGTVALLDAMRSIECSKLVFSSSGAVYGSPETMLISETFPCVPINPYGTSKWMIERLLLDYRDAYGLASFALRYFNASGAHPSGLIGELRDQETHLIPRALMTMKGILPELHVYGDDYDTPDGTAVRDYIHVVDLAAAHVLVLEKLLDGHPGGTFNLGTGTGVSVKQVLAAIETRTGRPVPHTIRGRRPGDPAILVADAAQARTVLNFVPQNSDLETIIDTAWAWHEKAHAPKAVSPPALQVRTS